MMKVYPTKITKKAMKKPVEQYKRLMSSNVSLIIFIYRNHEKNWIVGYIDDLQYREVIRPELGFYDATVILGDRDARYKDIGYVGGSVKNIVDAINERANNYIEELMRENGEIM